MEKSKIGEKIWFLRDYNWECGIISRIGPRRYHIKPLFETHEIIVPREKCAFEGECICVVWETWRGRNGRGGYRVEREMYSTMRVPAEQVDHQPFLNNSRGRITENVKPLGL